MIFAIHHAIADGWTLGVFVQDLCAAYVQERMRGPDKLPPVPTSYSAWGAAERAFWHSAELEPRIAFWKSRLTGILGVFGACRTKPPSSFCATIGFAITGGDQQTRAGVSPSQRRHTF